MRQPGVGIPREYIKEYPAQNIIIKIENYNEGDEHSSSVQNILADGRPGTYKVNLRTPQATIQYIPMGDADPLSSEGGMFFPDKYFKKKDPNDPFNKRDPDDDHLPPPGGSGPQYFI